MTKIGYHSLLSRMLIAFAVIGLAATLNSCATTPATYSNPAWAQGVSDGAPYYYFPDYSMYYDAAGGQYYYQNNGAWIASGAEPYPGVDLNDSYVVALDRNVQRPWQNHDYYARNYPPHEREQYQQVVQQHNLIPNVPQGHAIVPRGYDENTDRVTFEERAQQQQQQGQQQQQRQQQQGQQQQGQQQQQRQQRVAVHQVPMQTIAPNMPAQARGYRWGGNQKGR